MNATINVLARKKCIYSLEIVLSGGNDLPSSYTNHSSFWFTTVITIVLGAGFICAADRWSKFSFIVLFLR